MRFKTRQAPANKSPDDFIRRFFHAAVIANTFLYIDGGQFSYMQDGSPVYDWASNTLSLDMSKDWTNSTVSFGSIDKPSGAPSLFGGSLSYYAPNNVIYSGLAGRPDDYENDFNGTYPNPPNLWALKPDNQGGGTWSQILDSDAPVLKSVTRPVDAAIAAGPRETWFLGGGGLDGSSLANMLQFDMENQQFNNVTTKFDSVWHGKLDYVPVYGTDGILIAFPGDSRYGLIDFSTVEVYDVTTQAWYNQTTTGDLPIPRKDHCVTGVASSQQTYEIFVYGGFRGDLGNETILVVGGGDPAATTADKADYTSQTEKAQISTKDPNKQGLGIFDMTTLQWNDRYSASASAYKQAEQVKTFYDAAGDSYKQGLLPEISSLMQKAHFDHVTNSTSTSTTSAKSDSKTTNKGAIAGGVVGGIAALALIIGVKRLLRRRRQRRNNVAEKDALPLKPEDQAYMSELHNTQRPHEMDSRPMHEVDGNSNQPNMMVELQ
ncbi:uncharacterized protein KY384_002352 [Bacidia gigantensis]|uniref:uncharacterized protein n=1 Tax=Bacidia gigantensis TaxID=2732470 RepID=UPI001D048C74|nr:uncharacterized protein KY384_002352 [Bacidia gigantensis]KAG8532475.1 hypothetical protein KY384_002352 [Bacidia gigantensis]